MASLPDGDKNGSKSGDGEQEPNKMIQTDHAPPGQNLAFATQAIHADDDDHLGLGLGRTTATDDDVAPPMHVSTTFRYARDPDELAPVADPASAAAAAAAEKHIYSRWTAPNSTRLERVLSTLLRGRALTYASGLAAYHAALVYLNPKRVAIGEGYHGCHGVLSIHRKLTGSQQLPLDCPASDLAEGDLIHLETPLNPTGEAFSIAKYAEKAHSRGAYLLVDATFGPPGLQDPFEWGADMVMHSGTKYLGGHSDMLCGVLATKRDDWFWGLWEERGHLGNVMGSFEGWLGIRSLRTLELRVQRQSENAAALVHWLHALLRPDSTEGTGGTSRDASGQKGAIGGSEGGSLSEDKPIAVRNVVQGVLHASVQADGQDGENGKKGWLKEQMPNGGGPVFAILLKSEAFAKRLPSRLALFHHATSLGGVESLIEWRKMSDPKTDPRLVRVSVGVERYEDLRDDFLQAFRSLAEEVETA
ncbi:MAG: hypothetical protein M1837_002023 [Sclerophora amabilis]|nr:MAG: hypothetical protein M1837_002023 [Sclerophora amabilis]